MVINNQKHLPPSTALLLPEVIFPPSVQSTQVDGQQGFQSSITVTLCCSFTPTLLPCSSVDPPHGLQSFRLNIHGLWFFREIPNLLQHEVLQSCSMDTYFGIVLFSLQGINYVLWLLENLLPPPFDCGICHLLLILPPP